jgi:Uma2 family endonuclease
LDAWPAHRDRFQQQPAVAAAALVCDSCRRSGLIVPDPYLGVRAIDLMYCSDGSRPPGRRMSPGLSALRATLTAMTALPLQPPRLLTVADFAAFHEATEGRFELQEGNVVVSPSPTPEHQLCLRELLMQIAPQVPEHLSLIPEVDIDLALVQSHRPGFVRIPDLVVVTHDGLKRRRAERGLLRADEVVLAIEIVSDGSHRTDHTIKHGEYADAGIPHYWILELGVVPALIACHLAGEFGYVDAAPVSGTFTAEEPFPVRLDLGRLG